MKSRADNLLARLEEMSRSQAISVLGLTDRDAEDPTKVKAAHRKAALANHPDRGGDPEKMKLANAARDVLIGDMPPSASNYSHREPAPPRSAGPTTPEEAAKSVIADWEDGNTDIDLPEYAVKKMKSWSQKHWSDAELEKYLLAIGDEEGGADPFRHVKEAQSTYCTYLLNYGARLHMSLMNLGVGDIKNPAHRKAQKEKEDAVYSELERARIEMILHGKNDPAKKVEV